eukprot:46964_3
MSLARCKQSQYNNFIASDFNAHSHRKQGRQRGCRIFYRPKSRALCCTIDMGNFGKTTSITSLPLRRFPRFGAVMSITVSRPAASFSLFDRPRFKPPWALCLLAFESLGLRSNANRNSVAKVAADVVRRRARPAVSAVDRNEHLRRGSCLYIPRSWTLGRSRPPWLDFWPRVKILPETRFNGFLQCLQMFQAGQCRGEDSRIFKLRRFTTLRKRLFPCRPIQAAEFPCEGFGNIASQGCKVLDKVLQAIAARGSIPLTLPMMSCSRCTVAVVLWVPVWPSGHNLLRASRAFRSARRNDFKDVCLYCEYISADMLGTVRKIRLSNRGRGPADWYADHSKPRNLLHLRCPPTHIRWYHSIGSSNRSSCSSYTALPTRLLELGNAVQHAQATNTFWTSPTQTVHRNHQECAFHPASPLRPTTMSSYVPTLAQYSDISMAEPLRPKLCVILLQDALYSVRHIRQQLCTWREEVLVHHANQQPIRRRVAARGYLCFDPYASKHLQDGSVMRIRKSPLRQDTPTQMKSAVQQNISIRAVQVAHSGSHTCWLVEYRYHTSSPSCISASAQKTCLFWSLTDTFPNVRVFSTLRLLSNVDCDGISDTGMCAVLVLQFLSVLTTWGLPCISKGVAVLTAVFCSVCSPTASLPIVSAPGRAMCTATTRLPCSSSSSTNLFRLRSSPNNCDEARPGAAVLAKISSVDTFCLCFLSLCPGFHSMSTDFKSSSVRLIGSHPLHSLQRSDSSSFCAGPTSVNSCPSASARVSSDADNLDACCSMYMQAKYGHVIFDSNSARGGSVCVSGFASMSLRSTRSNATYVSVSSGPRSGMSKPVRSCWRDTRGQTRTSAVQRKFHTIKRSPGESSPPTSHSQSVPGGRSTAGSSSSGSVLRCNHFLREMLPRSLSSLSLSLSASRSSFARATSSLLRCRSASMRSLAASLSTILAAFACSRSRRILSFSANLWAAFLSFSAWIWAWAASFLFSSLCRSATPLFSCSRLTGLQPARRPLSIESLCRSARRVWLKSCCCPECLIFDNTSPAPRSHLVIAPSSSSGCCACGPTVSDMPRNFLLATLFISPRNQAVFCDFMRAANPWAQRSQSILGLTATSCSAGVTTLRAVRRSQAPPLHGWKLPKAATTYGISWAPRTGTSNTSGSSYWSSRQGRPKRGVSQREPIGRDSRFASTRLAVSRWVEAFGSTWPGFRVYRPVAPPPRRPGGPATLRRPPTEPR